MTDPERSVRMLAHLERVIAAGESDPDVREALIADVRAVFQRQSPVTAEEGAAVKIKRTEHSHGGCSVTWDAEAQAGYAYAHPEPPAYGLTTVHVEPGLLVDLDSHGFVCGVETIGHEVGIGDLLAVLRHCRIPSRRAEGEQ